MRIRIKQAFIAAVIVTLCAQISGCFFFFIPGSVVGAVSDSITGARGENCVSASAKVGDPIRLPEGGLMRVKSLSGSSTRCTNDKLPLRAELEPMPAQVTADQILVYQTAIDMALPAGWTKNTLTPAQISSGFKVVGINRNIDSGVSLAVGSRTLVTDVDAYVQSRRAAQLSQVENGTATIPVISFKNGRDEYSFEVKGSTITNLRIHYLTSIFFSQKDVVLVTTWTTEANMENRRLVLAGAPGWVTGVE